MHRKHQLSGRRKVRRQHIVRCGVRSRAECNGRVPVDQEALTISFRVGRQCRAATPCPAEGVVCITQNTIAELQGNSLSTIIRFDAPNTNERYPSVQYRSATMAFGANAPNSTGWTRANAKPSRVGFHYCPRSFHIYCAAFQPNHTSMMHHPSLRLSRATYIFREAVVRTTFVRVEQWRAALHKALLFRADRLLNIL